MSANVGIRKLLFTAITHKNDQNTLTVVNYLLQKRKLSGELELTTVEDIECHFHMFFSQLSCGKTIILE